MEVPTEIWLVFTDLSTTFIKLTKPRSISELFKR